MRSKRKFGLAVSCALLVGGFLFASQPATTRRAYADEDPTPTNIPIVTPTPGGGDGGDGTGGGGHGGGS